MSERKQVVLAFVLLFIGPVLLGVGLAFALWLASRR
jgi:hypothetical protein